MFGRSLGACAAGEVALRQATAGIILEGAFPSIQSMADQHYLGLPARWFVNFKCNLEQKVAKLQVPMLIIHGEKDAIVPIDLGRQVFDAAQEPKQWYVVSGAGHNDVPAIGGDFYFQRIVSFVRKVAG